jgi:nucleoside 2-deoxyribosyltransferase
MKPSVYLAGPISGESFDAAEEWRLRIKRALSPDIDAFSPLRAKVYLSQERQLADSYENYPLSSKRGIFTRDHFDSKRCDLLFVNMLGAKRVSIGTVMEIAWAHAYDKPIVLVMEQGNIHEHAMLNEACPFRVDTLDEALFVTRAILLP